MNLDEKLAELVMAARGSAQFRSTFGTVTALGGTDEVYVRMDVMETGSMGPLPVITGKLKVGDRALATYLPDQSVWVVWGMGGGEIGSLGQPTKAGWHNLSELDGDNSPPPANPVTVAIYRHDNLTNKLISNSGTPSTLISVALPPLTESIYGTEGFEIDHARVVQSGWLGHETDDTVGYVQLISYTDNGVSVSFGPRWSPGENANAQDVFFGNTPPLRYVPGDTSYRWHYYYIDLEWGDQGFSFAPPQPGSFQLSSAYVGTMFHGASYPSYAMNNPIDRSQSGTTSTASPPFSIGETMWYYTVPVDKWAKLSRVYVALSASDAGLFYSSQVELCPYAEIFVGWVSNPASGPGSEQLEQRLARVHIVSGQEGQDRAMEWSPLEIWLPPKSRVVARHYSGGQHPQRLTTRTMQATITEFDVPPP